MQQFDNIPELALQWHRAGRGAVLVTVVETWGSAPRRVGAQMVVSADGDFAGSVSGGCVEAAVVVEAGEVLQRGQAKILEFGISDGDAFAVGLACGGTIRLLLEPVGDVVGEALLQELVSARKLRQPVAYVVDLTNETRCLQREGHEARFRRDQSGFDADGQRFVAIHNPGLRLIVVGAVHIAQALLPMARLAGYDPVVVDPRTAFASAARFPGAVLNHDWPDEALEAIGLDARCALVLLTHDPKLDDPALHVALGSDVFYIGALGSTRTHAKRVERLQSAGFQAAEIDRIHGPVGLDIGASSPAEIALAILAEMTQELRRGL